MVLSWQPEKGDVSVPKPEALKIERLINTDEFSGLEDYIDKDSWFGLDDKAKKDDIVQQIYLLASERKITYKQAALDIMAKVIEETKPNFNEVSF